MAQIILIFYTKKRALLKENQANKTLFEEATQCEDIYTPW